MEVFRFGDDSSLGTVAGAVALANGDIVVLALKSPDWSLVRCNFRGEPMAEIALSGVPGGFCSSPSSSRPTARCTRSARAAAGCAGADKGNHQRRKKGRPSSRLHGVPPSIIVKPPSANVQPGITWLQPIIPPSGFVQPPSIMNGPVPPPIIPPEPRE